MTNTDDYIGTSIGNYTVGARIASGQFGSVYYGKHQHLDRLVAIKLLHMIYLRSTEERETFLREGRILARLEHPHCLRVYDAGIDNHNQMPYIISQYAFNGSLADRLANRKKPLPLDDALRIVSQIGQGLQHAHDRHLIHRDLKPENILFDEHDNVLLADFGLAVVIRAASVLQVNTAGTPEYMSPEQFRGEASKRSDQYALGCVAYELVTGHLPFEATTSASLGYLHTTQAPTPLSVYMPSPPPHVEYAILKAMAKVREDRYASIAHFIAALTYSSIPQPETETPAHIPAISPETPPGLSAAHLSAEGDALSQQQRYTEALQAYQQALRLEPSNNALIRKKATALVELKRYEEALALYEQMAQLDAHALYAYLKKGALLHQLKCYKEALNAYHQALRIDPKEMDAHVGKCKALLALKRYDSALVACNVFIQLHPQQAIAYNEKALAHIGLQQYDEALKACEQALAHDHNFAAAYHNKGYLLDHLQRYQEALQVYEQALHLNPNDITTAINKGSALVKLQRYQEALAVATQLLRRDPHLVHAHLIECTALHGLQLHKEALFACAQALALEPDLALAHACKGDILQDLGRIPEAQRAYQKARELGYHDI